MIIFNTTYCIDFSIHDKCMNWIINRLVPQSTLSGQLHTPRIAKILSEEGDGVNYSVQFLVENVDVLQLWYEQTGDNLHHELRREFGEQVLGFSTLMEEVIF